MSYAGTKSKVDWATIRQGKGEAVDFIDSHNLSAKFLFSGMHVKWPVAEFLLERIRDRELDEEAISRWQIALGEGRVKYVGAFSTIHIDTDGYVVDIQHMYELLKAICITKCSV